MLNNITQVHIPVEDNLSCNYKKLLILAHTCFRHQRLIIANTCFYFTLSLSSCKPFSLLSTQIQLNWR